jgi:uncharacterized protein YjbI with pentapeptide repeats
MESSNEGFFDVERIQYRNREEEQRHESVSASEKSDLSDDSKTEAEAQKKTLLDWLNFGATLVTSVATLTISYGLYVLSQQQYKTAEARQKHEIISSYLAQMAQLQLDTEFQNLPDAEAKQIASAATLNTLRQLEDKDGESKGQLLKFLYKANLIGGNCETNPTTLEKSNCQTTVLDLGDAKLDGTMFQPPMPHLPGINLQGASLVGSNWSDTDLSEAKMSRISLNGAILTNAILRNADLNQATLEGTNLAGATLIKAKLSGSSLDGAILENTNLAEAKLVEASLINANLQEANLKSADLQQADLRNANLTKAVLEGVNLAGAVYNDATIFPEGFVRDAHGMELCTTPIEQECDR